MRIQRTSNTRDGFTLMELMVAMAITTIIVTVLVSVTSIAIDTWNRSRAELRASRQAKAMVEAMARDFEGLVTRSGNTNMWLSAESPTTPEGGNLKGTNSADLVFFTSSTDRYDGNIGVTGKDKGGDVSCVGYRLKYKDPILSNGTFQTFVLNRLLVNPDETFTNLLGKPDISPTGAFSAYYAQLNNPAVATNFVCENIYQFTVTFRVEVTQTKTSGGTTTTSTITVPVTVGQNGSNGQISKYFRIKGTGIDAPITTNTVTAAELAAGRLKAVEISITVLSDAAVDQQRKRTFSGTTAQADFLQKNSYQYTKLVQLTSS